MMIYGDPETFKSWITIDMAFKLANGDNWLIFPTQKSRVLIFQAEQDEFDYQDRFLDYTSHWNGRLTDEMSNNLVIVSDREFKMDHPSGRVGCTELIKEVRPDVIVIDNLSFAMMASEKDEFQVKQIRDTVSGWQQAYKTGVIIVHHARKGDGEDDRGMQEASGTYVLTRWADTVIRPYLVDRDRDMLKLEFQKTKNTKHRQEDVKIQWRRDTTDFMLL
jgi:RecA-family ATPase